MKRTKLLGLCLVTILLFMLLSSQVLAWGLLPARQLVPFTSQEQDLKVTIVNTKFDEGYFKVRFDGDLAEHVTYQDQVIYISPDVDKYTVPFSLTVPTDLTPGKNVLEAVIEQVPSEQTSDTFRPLLVLISEFIVNAPYQGTYVSSEVTITGERTREPVQFTISMLNKGGDAVVTWADIVVRSPTNKIVASWSTDKTIIDYAGSGKIETYWDEDKESGLYTAEITLHYGEKTELIRKEFLVGSKEVYVDSISSDRFSLGDIVPLTLSAVNTWNDLIKDVYAEITVKKDGTPVQTFKTSPEDIPAGSKRDLTTFWDTNNLVSGSYLLDVLVYFDGLQTQQDFPAEVRSNELVVGDITGNIIAAEETKEGGQYTIFIILLLVLIVMNAVIIFYFKQKGRGGKK